MGSSAVGIKRNKNVVTAQILKVMCDKFTLQTKICLGSKIIPRRAPICSSIFDCDLSNVDHFPPPTKLITSKRIQLVPKGRLKILETSMCIKFQYHCKTEWLLDLTEIMGGGGREMRKADVSLFR